MSIGEDIAERIHRSMSRLDTVSAAQARRLAAQLRADDAEAEEQEQEREESRRDTMRRHADRCDQHQRRYDEAFEGFGKKAPPPAADAFPPDYRRDLFKLGQSMLPSGHDLTKFSPDDLDHAVIIPFEAQLFEALAKEAQKPSGDNVPESPDDPQAKRERTDSMGTRKIEWVARDSFIKAMNRAPRRVAAIHTDRGSVYCGPLTSGARR